MIIPFFLTRQTANLMEDFARELKDGPALFLLYGENGVGKTRLLQELCQSRFGERTIHWLDLGSGDSADGTRLDYSHGIEELFGKAEAGDIIIADHFDEALKKTRHQLFLSWSTDGIDKKLNMIIGSSNEGFNEMRQLSQQYQVRVQSFQQMPFSTDEVESFLGFCLFPDQPVNRLKIPGPVRKQLAATQGNVGRIIEIIDNNGKQIKSPPASDSQSIRQGSKIIVGVLGLFIVAIGAGWIIVKSPFFTEEETLAATAPVIEPAPQAQAEPRAVDESPGAGEAVAGAVDTMAAETAADDGDSGDIAVAEVAPEAAPGVAAAAPDDLAVSDQAAPAEAAMDEASVSADADEPGTSAVIDAAVTADPASETMAAQDGEPGSASELAEADAGDENLSEVAFLTEPEPEAEAEVEVEVEAEAEGEPGTVSDSEAVIDESIVEPEAVVDSSVDKVATLYQPDVDAVQPQSNWDRFARELSASMDWIKQHEDQVGTVQILLLTFDTFDADVYYQYVASLARKNVDTDRLHVFKTLTGNKEVYSVFYGEFASRSAAFDAIDELPGALRDTSPIPRTVGGIWQEIRRLEAKN